MNHGVVMFQRRDMPESRIWKMAMGHGQFIAVYAARSTERSADGSASQVWSSALVPTTGGPMRYPPSDRTRRAWHRLRQIRAGVR